MARLVSAKKTAPEAGSLGADRGGMVLEQRWSGGHQTGSATTLYARPPEMLQIPGARLHYALGGWLRTFGNHRDVGTQRRERQELGPEGAA